MTSLPRNNMYFIQMQLVTVLVFFCSLYSEGVAANCSQPNCQDEIEAAACPPDSIPDPNTPGNGCICANKCPPQPSCKPPAVIRLQTPATGEPSSCCDLYECIEPQEKNCSEVLCDIVEQISCPSDSFRLPSVKSADECCSVPQGCQCLPELCHPPSCKAPLWPKVVRPGDGKPGSCCPLYNCVENESNQTCTFDDGKVVNDGATWRKSECTLCTCKNGHSFCDIDPPCPQLPEGCAKSRVPKGKCCPVCVEKSDVHQKGCISGSGEFIKNGESWQEDDCTFCVCRNGERSCQAFMCEACANPRYVPHECCPVCDESSIVTIPPHCQALTNCSLRCVHGFVRDEAGCFMCQCQQDECVLECPQGYAQDKHGNKLCECATAMVCPTLNCKKSCQHGYRLNKFGCPTCKCDSCKPLAGCSKKCPHGLLMNKNNCPICECLPADINYVTNATINMKRGKSCNLEGLLSRDDGEMWFDGCRQCYCIGGIEMCSPLVCPPTDCPSHLLNTTGCCPVCPGSQESVKKHMVCGGGDGMDRLHVEGEMWNLSNDITCICQGGRTLCHFPPCPPAPCRSESMITSDLECSYCSVDKMSADTSEEVYDLSRSCEGHQGVSIWRENDCVSCLCDVDHSVCFTEVCSSEPCSHPLHLKGRCCPICLDSIHKNIKLPTLDVTESSKEVPVPGCVVKQSNVTKKFGIGEEWRVSDCVSCKCIEHGQTLCTKETCILPTSCTKPVKTPGICCQTCLDSEGSSGLGHEKMYIVIISVVLFTMVIVTYLIARHCRSRRQLKLAAYGCPPPQYHQYKFVPSYESPQSQSIRTTEKSALSPV